MKNLKLFHKIFLYVFLVLFLVVSITHLAIYILFPRTYLDSRKENLNKVADSLAYSLEGRARDEIENSTSFLLTDENLSLSIKTGDAGESIKVDEKMVDNPKSSTNSLIIEERTILDEDQSPMVLQVISSKDMKKEAADLSLSFLPYSLVGSTILSLLLAMRLSKTLTNPIVESKKTISEMMVLNKKARLSPKSNDEFGQLQLEINSLYQRLLGLIEDLDMKNKEILAMEKRKVDFLRSTAHELKTPLQSLRIVLENMKYGIGPYKDIDKSIEECTRLIDQLNSLVVDTLAISTSNEIQEEKKEIPIFESLDRILETYRPILEKKAISLKIQSNKDKLYMSGLAFERLMDNLVSNAVKHSYENGSIEIYTEDGKFFIENTGGFMTDEEISKAFDLNYTKNREGNGLGLYIVKNILLMNGLSYSLKRTDRGMVFSFSLE